MRLTYFTVQNYRSITNAYRINLQDITVLVGKNNEGKSNLIRALNLAMDITRSGGRIGRRLFPSRYNWVDDFPLQLQNSKKLKRKESCFRLDFSLNEAEVIAFRESIKSSINGELSVFISINKDGICSITVPKRGKNATALTAKMGRIADFISHNITFQVIPAIRAESDAYDIISEIVETEFSSTEDQQYKDAVNYIEEYRKRKLQELSERIKKPVSQFLPALKSINLSVEDRYTRKRQYMSDKNVVVEIDDGVKTKLQHKGDGVKSLVTMAILSQTDEKNRIIIVDEPENHLHPEAIHYLRKVLYDLSQHNQVVIITHNPIFVNRCTVSSNIIVDKNEAKPASRIDDVRKVLGVQMSDNLAYSDFVIVVEGPSDKALLQAVIKNDNELKDYLDNIFTIRSIGGTHNLIAEILGLERYLCHYIIILDNDNAGKETAKEAKDRLSLPNERFRFFMQKNMRESELEDFYDISAYKDYLLEKYSIDISVPSFKDKRKKWSDRINEIAQSNGITLGKKELCEIKEEIGKLVVKDGIHIDQNGQTLINGILETIRREIKPLV